ncbi:hypothetical protein AMATHDRAFT_75492 [Amanita thiersii Skay4041]|uniref:Lysine-specific metallo-endopeptidase domain-containing protein n=1 Tax=Amanita thiersii Skay4041 TaxID=703135 RepID=A0A2A9NSG0_9AGAR|nr:hypothetical protein AMATHDRAFT_75492 [Amanita thiersii Skay4041]
MFSTSLRSALLFVAASALAVSAAPSLSLKVDGPASVDTVADLKVTATITNTGDETVKVLNDPYSALSKLPTNTFKITDTSGAKPSFTGIKAKYVPNSDAALSSFTTLAPGQSVSVEHDLSQAYNFTTPGAGAYSVEARNLFYVIDEATNEAVPTYATAEAHSAKLSGVLAVARPSVSKRAVFNGCSSTQQSGLNSAASAAQSYASSALSYLNAHLSATTRYVTWFGTYTSTRHSTVQSHFSHISSNSFSSFTYDCTCTDSGTYAYVFPDDFGHIYLCGAFWSAPNTGTDSRGGTLIHESSHFTANGGTDDYVYGQSGAKSLAISNPDEAVFNADSHEYFAENNPAQS